MPAEDSVAELERRIEVARVAAKEFAEAARRHWGKRLISVRLYGSFARGDASVESDLDILVLLDRLEPDDRTGPAIWVSR